MGAHLSPHGFGVVGPVSPPLALPFVPTAPSEGSLNGQEYVSASGDDFPNLREVRVNAVTEDGSAFPHDVSSGGWPNKAFECHLLHT